MICLLQRWVVAAGLAVVMAYGQTAGSTSPGGPSPENAATLAPLLPLIPELQNAIQAGDVDRSYMLIQRFYSDLAAARKSVYSYGKNLARIEEALREHPNLRSSRIAYLAMSAAWAEEYGKAKAYAAEALANATRGSQYEAQNLYYGNEVMGLVELNAGNVTAAKQYLLLSASKGWPQLDRYGPNTGLAKALLARGERDAVIEYLERSKALWPSGSQKLKQWQDVIRAGATPDFGSTPYVLP